MINSIYHSYNRRELNQTGVYEISHTSKPNIFYIGSASKFDRIKYRDVGFLQRWRNHLGTLRRGIHSNMFLQRVVNKYGVEGVRFKIIEVVPPEKCIVREDYYLQLYNTHSKLYNINEYGNSRLGVVLTEQTKSKIGKGRDKKKVYQFSFNGDLINTHECLYHVLKYFPNGSGSIWNCLRGKQQTSCGYIWSYESKFTFKPFNKSKQVIQIDKHGNYINCFSSGAEAHRITGISCVSACCRGERKSAGGYYWKFKQII